MVGPNLTNNPNNKKCRKNVRGLPTKNAPPHFLVHLAHFRWVNKSLLVEKAHKSPLNTQVIVSVSTKSVYLIWVYND